jgi:nitronate monooxygenase
MVDRDVFKTRLRLPVISAPLFIVSGPELVIAQCKSQIVGSFPSLNARTTQDLENWLEQITQALAEHDGAHPEALSAPFAVNLVCRRDNTRVMQDAELCAQYKVPLVITSAGAREDVYKLVHSYGGLIMHDVINQSFARKAVEKGADGLILVAAGAGGHAGKLSPFALVQETRAWFDGPIALSGAITTGRSILATLALGADYAYIGSAFIATEESRASDGYKASIVTGAAKDVVYTDLFSGIHANYLRETIAAAGLDPENLPGFDPSKMDFRSGGNMDAKAWRDIWSAGQGIGVIEKVSTVDKYVEKLAGEFEGARRELMSSCA